MLNKHGGKVRLTFKLELDQIWIGTKERTEKVNMNHIRQIVSEAIEGFEEYHIMVRSYLRKHLLILTILNRVDFLQI